MTVSVSSITVYNGAKGLPSRNRFEASNWALLLLITPLASDKAVLPSLLLPPILSSPVIAQKVLPLEYGTTDRQL